MRDEGNELVVPQAPSTPVPEPNAGSDRMPSPRVPAGDSRAVRQTGRAASAARSQRDWRAPGRGGARGDQSRDRRTSGGREQRRLALALEQRWQLFGSSAAKGSVEIRSADFPSSRGGKSQKAAAAREALSVTLPVAPPLPVASRSYFPCRLPSFLRSPQLASDWSDPGFLPNPSPPDEPASPPFGLQ